MVLVKILKRGDATSVIVAIVAAFVIVQFIGAMVTDLSVRLSGLNNLQVGASWQQQYLQPFVAMILSFVALEILARVVLLIKLLLEPTARSAKKRK